MQIINFLNDAPQQKINITLYDNSILTLELEYKQNQNGWFFNLKNNDFILNGKKLVVSLNLLNQFRNTLNFGLQCLSSDGLEPFLLTDFIDNGIALSNNAQENRRIILYILEKSEVIELGNIYEL